jgi:uncharacterized membrane protein
MVIKALCCFLVLAVLVGAIAFRLYGNRQGR